MKAITFLGATQAHETTYVMPDGREQTAPFFGVALARFYPDLSMQVFVTEKARQMHWADFQRLTEDFVAELEPVDIPDGANEAQLWTLFQSVVDAVDDGEQVIFDITHGFRSLPFLSFLAAAYLRTVKRIELEAVLYGNFEARDQTVKPNRAPVIDLTEFVALLDWMTAADRFIRFGDAQDLARQLERTKPDYRRVSKEALSDWSNSVGKVASAMSQLSLSLRLLRPYAAMTGSDALRSRLLDAAGSHSANPRPFQILSRRVSEAYAPLALTESQIDQDPIGLLGIERELVSWYLDRNQLVQAVAVAREWVVSWAMIHLGHREFLDRDAREGVEGLLGQAIQAQKQNGTNPSQANSLLASLPGVDRAVDIYAQLGNVRNDLMHAGKRKGALTAKTLDRKARELCSRLDELPLPAV
ncbi:MAG: TIGR02221 family CRISPR-associated protein [Chloroflexi bacterium]|nr:MAG: TIGR02221 family CRISPR-associated protein [Chloroflexota bacterium]